MRVFKLKENYKHSELLLCRNNTRDLFCTKVGLTLLTDTEEKTYKELTELLQSGKIAIFPIWGKQKLDNIRGHIHYGFDIYFMRYKDFNAWAKWYMKNCVELIIEEEK